MPLVQISILNVFSIDEKSIINKTIHNSLVEAFKIPNDDYNHRIFEFEKDNFRIPDGKSERYMIIEMTIFPGRSIEAKRKLYESINSGLEIIGLKRSEILIVLNEPQMDSWGILGKPGSEIDLGFKISI